MINLKLINISLLGESPSRSTVSPESLKRLWWQTIHRNQQVRFSISALVRIKLADQYLLVRGNRVRKFQPVGGVLKFLPSARNDLERCGMQDDILYPPDEINKDDLRVMISGRRLCRFLDWYESGLGREQSPWREFWEELVRPGYLDGDLFPHARFGFLRRHSNGIRWSNHANCYECMIAEIFELHPNSNQRAALESLRKSPPENLCWTTAEQIRSNGITPKEQTHANIAEHAEWILPR